jgi:D-arginine dehydrogenase
MGMLDAFLQENSGIDRLTPDEACAIVPVLRRDRIAGACLERDALDIDIDRLLQGMAGLVRGRGGRIETDQRVQGIVRQAGIWAVETATQRIEAPVIVNAAGAWADQIAAMAGAQTIGLQPLRRSAVKMAVPQSVSGSASWPLFASVAEDWYAKPEGGGLMISPADEDPISPQDAWPDDMVLAEGLHRFEQMVDLPIVRPSHSWAGLRSFVADRTPVAGFAPETEGFFWLAGQGGYGVQTSPAMAAVTRALCCHAGAGVEPDLLAMLSPARFLG